MNEKILIITGPTTVGKTAIAECLAQKIAAEIISADSRQVYRYLTIGTAKPVGVWKTLTADNKVYTVNDIFYHLVDFIDPTETFSAGEFVTSVLKLISRIQQRKHRIIIVGGTGLYIQALTEGLAPLPPANQNIRKKYQEIIARQGVNYLLEKLRQFDPILAEKIGPNPQRLVRALEIIEITGKSPRDFYSNTKPFLRNYCLINLDATRQVLSARIKKRVEIMIKNGLIEETEDILKKYPADCPGLQSIGYPEAIRYLNKKCSKVEMIQQIFLSTKKYAKRQQTWARGHNYPTLDVSKMSTAEVVEHIIQQYNVITL